MGKDNHGFKLCFLGTEHFTSQRKRNFTDVFDESGTGSCITLPKHDSPFPFSLLRITAAQERLVTQAHQQKHLLILIQEVNWW